MVEQQSLLDWQPPPRDRKGETYSHALDYARLNAQEARVFATMKDGTWMTLRAISDATGDPEASVSARIRGLRHLRTPSGVIVIDRQRFKDTGTHMYRLRFK